MRLSRDFFYTLREDQRDEDSDSGNLLVRAGMIKKSSSGVYMLMPLGLRVIRKIESIVREEMEAIHSREVSMPALLPEEVFVASGRRDNFGDSMFSLKDRFDKPFVLGPTHEELFAQAAKMEIKSYKDLPRSLYQFQTKFRDEPRPRFGLIRVREFTMKDAYTFDRDLEGLDVSYQAMFEAYKRIFDRMGLKYVIVHADTGAMGGLLSEEFQAVTDIGEDILVLEDSSGYASNLEVAECIPSDPPSEEPLAEKYESVDTPAVSTIDELVEFLKTDAKMFVKTMFYRADDAFYAVCVRGDREVNELKLSKLLGVNEVQLAEAEDVVRLSEAPVGFAGPIGLNVPVIIDLEVEGMRNFIVGANKADTHYINVNLRDFDVERVADIREIQEGDMAPNGAGPVYFMRGIEVGNTFKLGDKYSEALDLHYTDENNELKPVIMGSYGIGIGRCLAAMVEQNNDGKHLLWPKQLAPIQVAIVPINMKNEEQAEAAEKLYEELLELDLHVVLDDRDERAGVKFNDMELVGAYLRITLGRDLADGKVEVKISDRDDKELVDLAELKDYVRDVFAD